MNPEQRVAVRSRRTRAEIQQLVAEFVSKRYGAERVLQRSRFELQDAGSTSEEAAMEEKEGKDSRERPVDGGGIGQQDVGVGE